MFPVSLLWHVKIFLLLAVSSLLSPCALCYDVKYEHSSAVCHRYWHGSTTLAVCSMLVCLKIYTIHCAYATKIEFN